MLPWGILYLVWYWAPVADPSHESCEKHATSFSKYDSEWSALLLSTWSKKSGDFWTGSHFFFVHMILNLLLHGTHAFGFHQFFHLQPAHIICCTAVMHCPRSITSKCCRHMKWKNKPAVYARASVRQRSLHRAWLTTFFLEVSFRQYHVIWNDPAFFLVNGLRHVYSDNNFIS